MPQSYKWRSFLVASRINYQATFGPDIQTFDYDRLGIYIGTIPDGVPLSSPKPYYLALRRNHCDDFMDGRVRSGWVPNAPFGGTITEAQTAAKGIIVKVVERLVYIDLGNENS